MLIRQIHPLVTDPPDLIRFCDQTLPLKAVQNSFSTRSLVSAANIRQFLLLWYLIRDLLLISLQSSQMGWRQPLAHL